jgi:hypothetical protein
LAAFKARRPTLPIIIGNAIIIPGPSNSATSSKTSASAVSPMSGSPMPRRCSESLAPSIESPDMIGTSSPLRISLGGGGTDLPSYYREHGGLPIAGAINRFVYVNVLRPFTPGIFLKYSRLEQVETIREVQHPIIRAALRLMDFKKLQIEITALTDIPAGTGLGSSGSFTTALLKALYTRRLRQIEPKHLADLACRIEIDILGEPIGKQDSTSRPTAESPAAPKTRRMR